ncbi:MAG: beta-propeller fold lactonase family protein [Terracidiphilus sp.]
MKFSKLSQLFLVSSIGLLVAALFTACAITTIDYVYVATSAGIDTYAADAQSGALRTAGAAVTSGVSSPVALAVTPDYSNLYVANAGNNTIVHYSISLTGTLALQSDKATLASAPVAITVNSAGTYLYAVSGTASATLTAYPLTSGAIGAAASSVALTVPGYASDTIIPTGVTVLANNSAVFATAYDQSAYNPGGAITSNANSGWIFGFTVGSSGALTAVTSGNPAATVSPWQAGNKPSALAADPTNRFVYVTDYANNQLIGYTIQDGNVLKFMPTGPFRTGNEPSAITIDPRGLFIYVTDELDSVVLAYTIVPLTGNPTISVNISGTQTNPTDTQPVDVIVDPALGRFVYTANYLGDSVSGFRLDATSGALSAAQATPYPSGQNPTALIAVPRGNHATQLVNP